MKKGKDLGDRDETARTIWLSITVKQRCSGLALASLKTQQSKFSVCGYLRFQEKAPSDKCSLY